MAKEYVCISLFNGMGCLFQALDRAGIVASQRISSEIDKYAIIVNDANYPDTIQLGSICDIVVVKDDNGKPIKLVSKNKEVDLLNDEIIFAGGSPCQSFSFAGKRKGMSTTCEQEVLTLEHYLQLKSQDYEFEGQSYLFWEYMRLMKEIKPKYFLLENVMMGDKWELVLSKSLGVHPIKINSALVSAQSRKRLYWTNIGMVEAGLFGELESIIKQPKDKGLLLKDILESKVDEKYFLPDSSFIFDRIINNHAFTPNIPNNNEKSNCIKIGVKGVDDLVYIESRGIIQHIIPEMVSVRKYPVDIVTLQKCLQDNKKIKKLNAQQIANSLQISKTMAEHWFRTDSFFSIPDKDIWLKLKELLEITTNEFDECIMTFEDREGVFEKANRVYDQEGIAPTLTSTSADERILVRDSINLVELPIIFDDYNSKLRKDGKTCTLTANSGSKSERNGQKVILETNVEREVKQINTNYKSNGDTQPYQQDRIYDINGISPALCANKSDLMITGGDFRHDEGFRWRSDDKSNTLSTKSSTANALSGVPLAKINTPYINNRIRRLTTLECMRLQTVDDNFKMPVSDSQKYKQLGNGWTIDVIAHILKYIKT